MSGPAAFSRIDTWVFDLDNTLYPPSCRLFDQIDARMTTFIAHATGTDGISARALQKFYYYKHGTTLRGLMAEEGIDPHVFMDFVHDIDHRALTPDPLLATALKSLPGKRYIYTNGSVRHAEKVSRALHIDHLFDGVFDIAAAGFVPKPEQVAYEAFLEKFGVDPARAAMFEDIPVNLEAPHALGMTTVLVTPREGDIEGRAGHLTVTPPACIHHTTDDLASFLGAIIAR